MLTPRDNCSVLLGVLLVQSLRVAHAASPSSKWEPTHENNRSCRTKHPGKVVINNLEGKFEKRLWPGPPMARRAWKPLRGGIAEWELQCPNPQRLAPGSFPQDTGGWRDEKPVLIPITTTHLGRICFPPAAPYLKGKHQLQTPTS